MSSLVCIAFAGKKKRRLSFGCLPGETPPLAAAQLATGSARLTAPLLDQMTEPHPALDRPAGSPANKVI